MTVEKSKYMAEENTTKPISIGQKRLRARKIIFSAILMLFMASQIGLVPTIILAVITATEISYGIIISEIINSKNYNIIRTVSLALSYLIAHIAAFVLFMDIYTYSLPILVLAALTAIAAQLYYKENTPKHFRQFCIHMSIIFFIRSIDFINILALLSSSLYLHAHYSFIIIYVIVNYDYLISHNSTGEYVDGELGNNDIAIPFIEWHAEYVFFFLGLISRNPKFPNTLKNINWGNLILGIIIGAMALWSAAMLLEFSLGNIFVACAGALPNAFSIISILILTPLQAYYEEYFFRHKLTEKVQNAYEALISKIWNKYLPEKWAADTKLAKNSYLVYSITGVFFALAHIASPGRNFSVVQSLATTLPAGMLYHKIYVDYGIEASTGIHAGNNILIWLNMLPIFIEATAAITPIPMFLCIAISLYGESIIALVLSQVLSKNEALEPVAPGHKAPTGSESFSNILKQAQSYFGRANNALKSYATTLGCL